MKNLLLISAFVVLVMSASFAAEPFGAAQGKPEAKEPLANRPSKPGPHLDKVKALGNNAWLNLGKPAPDQKYGPAQGRAWGRKMAFAPDLRGAFIYGEGVHGGTTRRGSEKHYNDDLYFYDINTHAWVCCYPGTPLNNPVIKLDPVTGFETNAQGEVIPVAPSVHAYWTSEYDTELKMFMFMPSPATPYWGPALGKFRPHVWKDRQLAGRTPCRQPGSPYYWDPKTGKWERRKAAGAAPGCNVDNAFFYSPRLKKAIYFFRGTYLYDYAANAWTKASDDGGGNGAYCYDSKRDRIYMVTGRSERDENHNWHPVPGSNRLRMYDIAANKWSAPPHKGDAGGGMESAQAFFTYDTANDVAVLHIHQRHHVYSPDANEWTALPQTCPDEPNWGASSGFYDPETNAHFYFNAGDSSTAPGNMWAWRYASPKGGGGQAGENKP